MAKINRKTLIILSLLLFLGLATVVLAQRKTELTYPQIPGLSIAPTTTKTLLPNYLKYVFGFILSLAGLACFVALVYGAIIFITSTGNPDKLSRARSQIIAAFAGAIISLGSYLVAQTINPELIIPRAPVLINGGVCLAEGEACENCGTGGGGNTFNQIEKNPRLGWLERLNPLKPLFVLASFYAGNSGGGIVQVTASTPDIGQDVQIKSIKFYTKFLDADIYPSANYQGAPFSIDGSILENPKVQNENGCYKLNPTQPITSRSVKLSYTVPGVYLCTAPYEKKTIPYTSPAQIRWECPAKEKMLSAGTSLLPADIDNQIKGLRIEDFKNTELWAYVDTDPNEINRLHRKCRDKYGQWWRNALDNNYYCSYPTKKYGVVLHDYANFKGSCELFLASERDLQAKTISSNASSVTIFTRNIEAASPAANSGVWFCENYNEEFNSNRSDCHGPFSDLGAVVDLSSPTASVPNDKISSIIINGNYVAILFADAHYQSTCQVFTVSDAYLRDDPIGRCDCITGNWGCQDCLSSFIIVPTSGQ
jgi:hypothetical protein